VSYSSPTIILAENKNLFSRPQQAQLFQLIRQYIRENPEIILEALETIQTREEIAQEEQQRRQVRLHKKTIEDSPEDPILGNPEGSVTVVEFFDYQCGYCKNMLRVLLEAINRNDDVKVILKEYPILGPVSMTAAQASLAAQYQNKFKIFHTSLMLLKGRISEAAIFQVAKEVGLDVNRLAKDMESSEVLDKLRKNRELGQQLLIRGTPALIIDDKISPGALTLPKLEKLISESRKRN
tara:strand:+ start:409 stop:1122 length:714 start_codon:yes stop_codon:yes gene_type:complete